MPHHVTQRGNRQHTVFFGDEDFAFYKAVLAEQCAVYGVEIWAWCLMPNHVHLIAVPETVAALALAIGETHKRYTRRVNHREGWVGHLWQARFYSCVMDEPHCLMAARYIERNPVRAQLVKRVQQWRWSSARSHLKNEPDGLVRLDGLLELAPDWRAFLKEKPGGENFDRLRKHVRMGRPLGDQVFLDALEKQVGRPINRGKTRKNG